MEKRLIHHFSFIENCFRIVRLVLDVNLNVLIVGRSHTQAVMWGLGYAFVAMDIPAPNANGLAQREPMARTAQIHAGYFI